MARMVHQTYQELLAMGDCIHAEKCTDYTPGNFWNAIYFLENNPGNVIYLLENAFPPGKHMEVDFLKHN